MVGIWPIVIIHNVKCTSLISAYRLLTVHFVVALDSALLGACINDIAHGKQNCAKYSLLSASH